jgi:hypothetical protein
MEVTVAQTVAQLVARHRHTLSQLGLTSLSQVGSFSLSGNVMTQAGLATPGLGPGVQTVVQSARRFGPRGYELLPAAIARLLPARNVDISAPGALEPLAAPDRASPLVLDVAYWAADVITIAAKTVVILAEPHISLVIVCNRLDIGDDVLFTWQEPTLPTQGKPDSRPTPGPAPGSTDRHRGTQGFPGEPGRPGNGGANGRSAPNLEIWAAEIVGAPAVALRGQSGGAGQPGGDGGSGGPGAKGLVSESGAGGLWCAKGPGNGGDGGRGGDGGHGGSGGHGGAGGGFRLFAPQDSIARFQAATLYIGVDGGQAGEGGAGGSGGLGGVPGSVGDVTRGCTTGGRRAGASGERGIVAVAGARGNDGEPGSFSFSVNATPPVGPDTAIINLSPQRGAAGDRITVNGFGFLAGDKVMIGDTACDTTFIQPQTLSFVVPVCPGGVQEVRVLRPDGSRSNPDGLYVLPRISEISPPRTRPGGTVRVRGSGFGPGSVVRLSAGPNVPDGEDMVGAVISATEMTFAVRRPAEVEADANGERCQVVVLSADRNYASNPSLLTLETYQVVVVGDSVQWGQGLRLEDKIHTQVAAAIRAALGNIGVYEHVFAHSGAVIDAPGMGPVLDGEVPASFPTVRQQVATARGVVADPARVDLVLVTGGANDVDIRTILNPTSDDDDLGRAIDAACSNKMGNLLDEVARRFPSARILVLGYFPILSSDSFSPLIDVFVLALGGGLGGLTLEMAKRRLVDRCALFAKRANRRLAEATAGVNNRHPMPSTRAFFAAPTFARENSALAGDPFLWGINPDGSAEDPVAGSRDRSCLVLTDAFARMICDHASAGHPNPKGVRAYMKAIIPIVPHLL